MTNVFLDLEGTVIEQWQHFPTFLPRNCEAIKQFLNNEGITHVRVFSYAIHTEDEVEEFDQFIKPTMEKVLGCVVIYAISVPSMQGASETINKIRFFDVCDFIQMRGKELGFHDWCHNHHPGEENVLIDDVVPNRTTLDHDTNTSIQTINIAKL